MFFPAVIRHGEARQCVDGALKRNIAMPIDGMFHHVAGGSSLIGGLRGGTSILGAPGDLLYCYGRR